MAPTARTAFRLAPDLKARMVARAEREGLSLTDFAIASFEAQLADPAPMTLHGAIVTTRGSNPCDGSPL